MIPLPCRRTSRFVLALLFLSGRVYSQTQTPGQVTQFDSNLNVVDSVITQDGSGNIGIGTTTPTAALDVASGDLNVAGNILKGGSLFLHNSGFQNTFLGEHAGNLTMTSGGLNTGVGIGALNSNTTGSSNTAIGGVALGFNTTGFNNTAIGAGALDRNTIGNENTATGFAALGNNDSGYGNTANGVRALAANTFGGNNTAIGLNALQSNTEGSGNTASGDSALAFNTRGLANTASGLNSLAFNTFGSDNTASGAEALLVNASGSRNTASGSSTLGRNITGNNNTAIGYYADVSADGLENATAIGSFAVVDASNKIRLGNPLVTVIEGQVPYTFTSDRNQKENFLAVDGEAVLTKLGGLNLTTWNYVGHNPQQFRHYGPVAQEFFAAFGQDAVGTIGTPTTINSGDMEGILMIAVQALEKRTAENVELRARIEALEKLVKGTTTEGR